MVNKIFGIFCLGFISFVAFKVITGSHQGFTHQKEAHKFVPVQATIVYSHIYRARPSSPALEGSVRYRYNVDGKEYESKRFSFFGKSWPRNGSEGGEVPGYPVGKTITAYFDPTNPTSAVVIIKPPSNTEYFSGIIFLVLVTAVIGAAAFALLKR